MNEALYYEKEDRGRVHCFLCPVHCHIMDGRIGACRARKNIGGVLYTLNYGKISALSMDPMEKKPLYHFYPGSSILSISSFGCNLKCSFCQNWELSQDIPIMQEVTVSDTIKIAKKNDRNIGIAYTYNEPMIWYEFVLDTAKKAKEEGLMNVLVTNGYIEEEPLLELLPYIDAMNIDLKGQSEFYKKICKGKLDSVKKTIEISYRSTHIEITNLIIPDLNDNLKDIGEMARWLSSISQDIPLHLSRYFPQYKMDKPETPIEMMLFARETAEKYLNYVYIGNVYGTDNNTYCPECHNIIVERGYRTKVKGIKDGTCARCGYKINIIF
ncbi:MAG: AmmeMemoRadiSam system radical SAM enzyme [Thermoanaerobacteraceae bacterium]|nr:AmmeMemoRadiSam system radical SAM enzyme [Thermoanaerobacteraceae bacterium]